MNIRISSNLKQKIQKLAKENNIKTSDFVRQTLEEALGKKDSMEKRILTLEENFTTDQKKLMSRMMYAAAHIANIDTNLPLEQCLSITLQTFPETRFNHYVKDRIGNCLYQDTKKD